MPKIEIINETPLSLNDLKSELKAIKKRDEELNARAQKVEEYINTFSLLNQKEAKDLEKAINALDVPRLKDLHVKKIVDVLPKTVDELKSVLQGYPISITNDNLKKVVDITAKVAEEKKKVRSQKAESTSEEAAKEPAEEEKAQEQTSE